jgi:hypothetical protein
MHLNVGVLTYLLHLNTDGWMDGWMDGWTDAGTDRKRELILYIFSSEVK